MWEGGGARSGDEEVDSNQIRLDLVGHVKPFKIPPRTQQENSVWLKRWWKGDCKCQIAQREGAAFCIFKHDHWRHESSPNCGRELMVTIFTSNSVLSQMEDDSLQPGSKEAELHGNSVSDRWWKWQLDTKSIDSNCRQDNFQKVRPGSHKIYCSPCQKRGWYTLKLYDEMKYTWLWSYIAWVELPLSSCLLASLPFFLP